MNNPNISKLIHPELSYKVVGSLFEVHKHLGGNFEEKYYQRALEKVFQKNNIMFERELMADIIFENEKIGKYFLDFLIEKKLVLELKTAPTLTPSHFKQVRSYLKVNNLELGILANFRGERLIYKRILNPNGSELK